MLVNVFTEPQVTTTYQGTRLLETDLGLTGVVVKDPKDSLRPWQISAVYSPIPGRAIGGVRAKLIDEKGFVTFCNQRDLEVLIGIGKPEGWCKWLGEAYVDPDSYKWIGLCADEEDLLDDLQEKEFMLRQQQYEQNEKWTRESGGRLWPNSEFTRRIHLDTGMDFEELFILFGDYDAETGSYPDTRLTTIEFRWRKSHRMRLRWDRV